MTAGYTANVWDIKVSAGQQVVKDQTLLVLEAMKMESPVSSPAAGVVKVVKAEKGQLANAGSLLIVIESAAA